MPKRCQRDTNTAWNCLETDSRGLSHSCSKKRSYSSTVAGFLPCTKRDCSSAAFDAIGLCRISNYNSGRFTPQNAIKMRSSNRWQIKIDQVSFLCSNRFSFCWLPSMLSAHLWLAWQICKLPTAGRWSIETRQVPASSHVCSKIYCGLFNLHIGTISDTCVMPCALGPGLFPLFWILFGQNVFAFWWHRAYKTASMRSHEQLGQSSSDWNLQEKICETCRPCVHVWHCERHLVEMGCQRDLQWRARGEIRPR